ncbi:MAG: tetratricopeptide repeat protein [Gemmatimonadales bacterium]
MSRWLAAGVEVLALAAIGGAGACGGMPSHERLGDQAYAENRYGDALGEYLAAAKARSTAGVWAKVGAAALHAGELRQSLEAYLRLAEDDPTRRDEAAEGLDGVARAAEGQHNEDVLQEVVTGLHALAPGQGTGRYALALVQQTDADTADLVALLPVALAAAGEPGQVDSLLTRYGQVLEATAGCGQALLQFRAVLRRSRDSSTRAPARQGAADCAYTLGRAADSAGRTQEAALWYAEAARVDSTTPTGRAALVRYGVARLAQGDTIAAAMAFQTVAAGGTADSAGQAATEHLRGLGTSDADSSGPRAR